MKLRNLVPNLRNQKRLTTAILREVIERREQGRAPSNVLDDIIGAVTGRDAEQSRHAKFFCEVWLAVLDSNTAA